MPRRRETRLHAFLDEEPAAAAPPPVQAETAARPVSEVVAAIQKTLASDPALQPVWVRGEVSGFSPASSGHWYFTLKDEGGMLRGVMWRSANARVRFVPQEGMEVLARGRVGLYAARGDLQLTVEDLRPVGVGALQLAFEQLKRRLEAEGLFDDARKRELPEFPETIGVVTSLHGAALHDVVRVATSRNPAVRILVANARVQGEGAAQEVAAAIARLNADGRSEALIVGRGGGSVEDLWAFNEEAVVRAVAGSRIPVVSAVGHETDFTLCDFAADARAATPSAAAELLVPDASAVHEALHDADERMRAALGRIVPDLRQRADDLLQRAEGAMRLTIDRERELLAANAARLDALSPLGVLSRGYAVARSGGRVVRSAADVAPGDDVEIVVRDGRVEAKVTATRRQEEPS